LKDYFTIEERTKVKIKKHTVFSYWYCTYFLYWRGIFNELSMGVNRWRQGRAMASRCFSTSIHIV